MPTIAAVHIGDTVPDFELLDQEGTPQRLSGYLSDGPVVLFFYPGAMTAGCTIESCHFRDLKSEFEAIGAQRVGISHDTVGKQKQFADKHAFDYPLLSDSDNAVAKIFGVHRSGPLPTKRSTFVIGKDSRVLDVVKSEVRMSVHADKALGALKARAGA
ncbi:MAG: thioredoxin-dependent peroxiredoxin [Acidimicrobiaceae bacterium]|nr:thioredoxin-dependent peroxiredoxin [Acidimicrobiaceae bacterium]MDQ1400224.1 thioredoxin-dependent peroxiredoxin [Acidimicrobiaceae bacterium]